MLWDTLSDHTEQNPVSAAEELGKDTVFQGTLVGFATVTTLGRPNYMRRQRFVLGRTDTAYTVILLYFEAVRTSPEFPSVYHTPSA